MFIHISKRNRKGESMTKIKNTEAHDSPGEYEHIYELRYADGKFWKYYDWSNAKEVSQDKYEIIHDIIAGIIAEQLNDADAYTSTSSIAGHHLMTNHATVIFIHGATCIAFDSLETYAKENESTVESLMDDGMQDLTNAFEEWETDPNQTKKSGW